MIVLPSDSNEDFPIIVSMLHLDEMRINLRSQHHTRRVRLWATSEYFLFFCFFCHQWWWPLQRQSSSTAPLKRLLIGKSYNDARHKNLLDIRNAHVHTAVSATRGRIPLWAAPCAQHSSALSQSAEPYFSSAPLHGVLMYDTFCSRLSNQLVFPPDTHSPRAAFRGRAI